MLRQLIEKKLEEYTWEDVYEIEQIAEYWKLMI